ncbi:MAG: hypothetical protein ACI4WM_02080 [Erysipelotrichaceae bacterium]
MKLNDNKLTEVIGGTMPNDKECTCLKCNSTFKVSLKPYICPNCGELKEGEYKLKQSAGRDVIVM